MQPHFYFFKQKRALLGRNRGIFCDFCDNAPEKRLTKDNFLESSINRNFQHEFRMIKYKQNTAAFGESIFRLGKKMTKHEGSSFSFRYSGMQNFKFTENGALPCVFLVGKHKAEKRAVVW